MSSDQQESKPNGQAVQPEDNLPKSPISTHKEIDQRSLSGSFRKIIRRLSTNSLPPPLFSPISPDREIPIDENDSPSVSSPETNDTIDEKRGCIKSRVLLQYCTLFALFFNQLISNGICYSLGVLYVSFRDEFKSTRATTALIISVCVGMLGFGGVFSGMLINRIGVRWSVITATILCFLGIFSSAFVTNTWHLLATLGILLGTGTSIITISTMVSVSKIFDKNKNSMIMLITLSVPLGTLLVPLLLNLLVEFYAWRGTLIFLSGLALNMCFAGILSTYCERRTTEIEEKPKYFDKAILCNKIYMVALIASSISSSCITAFNLLVVDFWKERGNSLLQSVSLLTIGSSAGISSRFFLGILNAFHDLTKYYFVIYYCSIIVGGFSLTLIPLCVTFMQIVVVVLILGFVHGIMSTVRPAIILKTIGLASYSVAFGLIYTVSGLGTSLATPIAGKISDLTQSYDISFYSAGITEGVTSLILFAVHLWLEKNQKKQELKGKMIKC